MSREKIIIAHCSENENVAREIANDLAATNFDFQLVACEDTPQSESLREQIGITDDKIILLISDNFLKSMNCMDGGLSYLQKLINSGRTLPVVIDGNYPQEGSTGQTVVPTKFERVSSVIKYMNFWQDEYLDMRKQKRSIAPDQEEAFNKRLKVVRAISSEVGEFLRFLRESYYCDYATLKDKDHLLFFQKFSDEAAYKAYTAQPRATPPAAATTLATAVGATTAATAIVSPNQEQETINIVEETLPNKEEIVATSAEIEVPATIDPIVAPIEEETEAIPTSSTTALPELPTIEEHSSLTEELPTIVPEEVADSAIESTSAVTEDLQLDNLVEEVLESETAVLHSETPIIPTHQEALKGEELLDPELATVFPELKEEVSDEEIDQIIEDLAITQASTQEASTESNLADKVGVGATIATAAATMAIATETNKTSPVKKDFQPLKESELLRTSHELIQQGAIEDGLFLLKTNLAVTPNMVAARYQYAVFLAQFNNDYREASEQLEVILNNDPKNLPANFFLGELAEAQGDFLSARNYYEKVEKVNPNFPNLNYKLGMLLTRRYEGNAELAASHLQKAYEKNARNIEALYQLGVIQNEGLSMPLDAIETFKEVLKSKPTHDFVNYDLALAYFKIGDKQEAAKFYEKACVINPELKTTENDMAFAITDEPSNITVSASATATLLDTHSEVTGTALADVGTASLVGAAVTESTETAKLNHLATETATAVLEETPDYTLDLEANSTEALPETTIAIEAPTPTEEPLELGDLGDLSKEEEVVTSEPLPPTVTIVDEEELEAEFDAQIDALGAAGLAIAAGAAVKEQVTQEIAAEEATSLPPVIKEEELPTTANLVAQTTINENTTRVTPTIREVYTNGASTNPVTDATVDTKYELEQTVLPPTSKVVLITGATSGIGKATAALFAKNGYDLILTGRRFSRLFKLKSEFETTYNSNIQLLPFDVRSAAAVKSAISELAESWRNVDILINNAGLAMGFDPIHEGSLEDWDTMIDTNVKGLLYMTRSIAPYMVKRNKGHIINISSIAGKEVYPNGNVYCATKHAVEALTKAMRIDLHKYNIRVSQIAPGHVEDTEFAQVRFHGDKERAKIYEDFVPINSTDVAEMIYFIATRPPHVNVQDILMMGTQQASATITDRSGRMKNEE